MRIQVKFILVLISILLAGCVKEVVLTEEQFPEEIFYCEDSNTPFSGKCIIYYNQTQQIHYLANYKKGILDGTFSHFYRNGNIEYTGNYNEGKLSGEFKKYDESGKLMMKYSFKN